MKTVFIVDDSEVYRMAAKAALDGVYNTFALPSAAMMLELAEKFMPNIILLDIEMPEMNGFEAITALKNNERLKSIPVIFLTGRNNAPTEIKGFELGALDFIGKPFSPPVLIKRIETLLETDKLVKDSIRSVRNVQNAIIKVITDVVDSRDKTANGHIRRTQRYVELLINELEYMGEEYASHARGWDMALLLPAAQLYDIGKIIVPDSILNKPGKLTDEEFEVIKTHAAEGEKIIERMMAETQDDGILLHAKNFAGYHHERWDGSGYPNGLSGTDIPLEGRIMAVADVYNALVSERPYKKPFSHEEAVEIIKLDSGTHYDTRIVEAFLIVEDGFRLVR